MARAAIHLNLVADVGDALEGVNWRQGDPKEVIVWSSGRACGSEPEQWPWDGEADSGSPAEELRTCYEFHLKADNC